MIKNKKTVIMFVITLSIVLTVLQYQGIVPGTSDSGTELRSVYTEEDIPATDPESSLWDEATSITVPISGQTSTNPKRLLPSVESVRIKSLNNGTHIAFRITWNDAVKNSKTTKNQEFRDALAIQIADKGSIPFVCMGSAATGTTRMHIMQWKSDWQRDVEEGFQDLEDSFPNFWVDYYPYAVGEPPYRVPEDFPGNASLYLPGYHVGNPFSDPLKVTSVEDAIADGYSTITTQAIQNAVGRGVWKNGTWSVVISRALDTGDHDDTVIKEDNILAFAVWDGESQDVGARKSVSSWVTLKTRGKTKEENPPYVAQICILILYVIALLAIIGLIGFGLKRKKKGKVSKEEGEATEDKPDLKEEEQPKKTGEDKKKKVGHSQKKSQKNKVSPAKKRKGG
ncbi:MAG: ethylbenzene dehydrogenase-related protein [Candidatus Thermoplasmatota archaeon]|nr:ethylbenzene dehydrogenase-related protein [Candidatus Thermoplasmatota archaeon]